MGEWEKGRKKTQYTRQVSEVPLLGGVRGGLRKAQDAGKTGMGATYAKITVAKGRGEWEKGGQTVKLFSYRLAGPCDSVFKNYSY